MIRGLGRSLAAKLIAAQLLVILAGAATLVLVAVLVAPGVFHAHVREALGVVPDAVGDHLDRAFEDAMIIALAIAVAAATVTAVAVSGLLAVRMLSPIRAMAEGARRIAAGDYAARVPATGRDELAVLGGAFNEMAGALEGAERRRQRLVSDVAHEFRTPLATLGGYLEGMSDGTLPRSDENVETLAHEVRRLTRLMEDLARISMAEERRLDLRLAPVEARVLVERQLQAAAVRFAEKGVRLGRRVEDGSTRVLVDEDRIAEVLANLLDNALRHTPGGGRVEIGTRRSGEVVQIWVSDSGEGIAPADLGRIFERFYRVDPARARAGGGSGIGLTISRAIVASHGGELRAESAGPGRGARFVVTLPRASSRDRTRGDG